MIRLKSLLLEQWGEKSSTAKDTRYKSDAEIEAEKQAKIQKEKEELKKKEQELKDIEAKRKKLELEKEEADRLEKERLEKEIQKQREKEDEIKRERENQRDIWRKEDEEKKKKEQEKKDKEKKDKEKELEDKKKEDKKNKEKETGHKQGGKTGIKLGDNWFGPISATGNGYEPRGHDAFGHGHWHASRKNSDGSTRPHRGLDIKSKAGDPVFSPMDCKIKRVYGIYPNKCYYLKGVTLEGTGEYSGYVFRLFYVKLASGYKVGQQIKKGDAFAIMQDLENRCYPPKKNGRRMTNHIHWEYYKNKYVKGKDRNPVPLIGMKKPD